MRVSILGFGLIGGSIARALDSHAGDRTWHVSAWSRNPGPLAQAVSDGVLASVAASLEEAIAGAELVILAAPPLECLDLVEALGGRLRGRLPEDCTVTDVASAKATIVAAADRLSLPFIGGHPVVDLEVDDHGAARPDLFLGRPWVTVLGERARFGDAERVGELVDACGAVPVPMKAAAHDAAVAAVSHLPLIVAAALIEAVAGGVGEPEREDWWAAEAVASPGWAGMTRLARGEPAVGAGLAATNAPAISVRLRTMRSMLDEWLVLLERQPGPDVAGLLARFEAARGRLADADGR